MNALYDRKGIPILPGDTLKIFHYVAAHRREKRYMYKWVMKVVDKNDSGKPIKPLMRISHLAKDIKSFYWELMDGRTLKSVEIVQGYGGVKTGQDYRDRPRNKQTIT